MTMSERTDRTLTMTESEFRAFIDEAFVNGTKAALEVMAGFIADLKAKAESAATPGTPGKGLPGALVDEINRRATPAGHDQDAAS